MLNEYALLGGGVCLAAVAILIGVQNHQIHKWHTSYDKEVTYAGSLQTKIDGMTTTQNTQTATTEKNLQTVVNVPGPVQKIVKTIHDAPVGPNCATPVLPPEDTNAF